MSECRYCVLKKVVVVGLCLEMLGGCSTVRNMTTVTDVKPWERGTLAKENMQLISDDMEDAVDSHIYFSKEASTGGSGIAGGGCGCN